ncbi:MAG: DnaJ domain-containing protein [Deltaproteobacteria bacterium]|nr:DnaJ domain-containing protein [Deltaproteobacteria bacterium]
MLAPKELRKWLILIVILYLVFPRDLIPDFVGGGLGLIDDLLVLVGVTYYFRKYARRYTAQEGARQQATGGIPERDSHATDSDPYAVLGISRGADQQEIQSAYRARMSEYHPDKVAHLGEDLQKLAHDRSLEIQQAYKRLRR